MVKVFNYGIGLMIITFAFGNCMAMKGKHKQPEKLDSFERIEKHRMRKEAMRASYLQDQDEIEEVFEEKTGNPIDFKSLYPYQEYVSPFYGYSNEELPSLNTIFGTEIPLFIESTLFLLNPENAILDLDKRKIDKTNLILYGPPGTGKSTVLEYIARHSGRKILYADAGSFKTKYQGSAAENIIRLFEAARAIQRPVAIIIDEIDALLNTPNANLQTSEDQQALGKIIVELDKEIRSNNIVLLCTTNHIDKLPLSFKDRFKRIEIPQPDYSARFSIISYYLNLHGFEINADSDSNTVYNNVNNEHQITKWFLKIIVSHTKGWTGRSLQALVNSAVTLARMGKVYPKSWSFWQRYATMHDHSNFTKRDKALDMLVFGWNINVLLAFINNSTNFDRLLFASYCQLKKDIDNENKTSLFEKALKIIRLFC